jgi:lipopolysaccharide transport system permease protein
MSSAFLSMAAGPIMLLHRHRALMMALVRREIQDRYVGQVLGAFWVFGHPLVLIAVYIFIFRFVCKLTISPGADMPHDYTTYILSGLIPWLACAETLGKSSGVITGNASLVKQVVFPIEILPIKTTLVSFVSQFLCTLMLIAFILINTHSLSWMTILLPILWFLQFLLMAGICYFVSSVGVYFRDAKDVIQVFTTIGVYLMPVAYLPEWVPSSIRFLLYLNPFSYLIWCYQDVFYYNRFEHPFAWLVLASGSLAVFYGGYRFFGRLRTYFGSAL